MSIKKSFLSAILLTTFSVAGLQADDRDLEYEKAQLELEKEKVRLER